MTISLQDDEVLESLHYVFKKVKIEVKVLAKIGFETNWPKKGEHNNVNTLLRLSISSTPTQKFLCGSWTRSLRTADAFPVQRSDDRKFVCFSQASEPGVLKRRKYFCEGGEPGVVKRGPRECAREWDKREMTARRFDAK